MIERWTVSKPFEREGRGLHSGVPVKATIHPGNEGIWFRHKGERVQAIPENVSETRRCTKLGSISTIEHLMSAFAGCGITDAEVELTAPELPALDGSALLFAQSILASGREKISEVPMPELFTRIFVQEEGVKIAISRGQGHWCYEYDCSPRWPGRQQWEAANVADVYTSEIAPARTFAFGEEIEAAQAAGLGRGLDESSVLILGEAGFRNEARFKDEPARHKLLDLIGDLYLAGIPVTHLNVSAERSGHAANVKAALLLRKALLPN